MGKGYGATETLEGGRFALGRFVVDVTAGVHALADIPDRTQAIVLQPQGCSIRYWHDNGDDPTATDGLIAEDGAHVFIGGIRNIERLRVILLAATSGATASVVAGHFLGE